MNHGALCKECTWKGINFAADAAITGRQFYCCKSKKNKYPFPGGYSSSRAKSAQYVLCCTSERQVESLMNNNINHSFHRPCAIVVVDIAEKWSNILLQLGCNYGIIERNLTGSLSLMLPCIRMMSERSTVARVYDNMSTVQERQCITAASVRMRLRRHGQPLDQEIVCSHDESRLYVTCYSAGRYEMKHAFAEISEKLQEMSRNSATAVLYI